MPKQPLHLNTADAVPPPGARAPLTRVISSSSTAPPVLLVKRRRSPSLSASPSPPPAQHTPPPRQPSPFSSSFINSAQAASLLGWQPEDLLHFPSSRTPSPVLPMPPPAVTVAAHPPSPAPISLSIAVPVPAPAAPLSDPPRPASPREWTLAEVIERCTTYEEYLLHSPVGDARLRDSWAVLDAAVRKRHYKQQREPLPVAYTHVRAYIERQLRSSSCRMHVLCWASCCSHH
jgi:hypothetical protein